MCDHLKHLRNTLESSHYEKLYEFYVTCTKAGSSKKMTLLTSCHVCQKSGVGARLHACLTCVFIGCLKDHFEKHREKHKFAMDLFFGAIYCFECKDYAYDEHFSNIAKRLQPSGQIKESFYWLPSEEDKKSFKNHRAVKMNQSVIGLRGLRNLGMTCYVNCIIQVFASTPMMRNYFLSGRHSCQPKKDDCSACQLSEIFQKLYSGNKDPLSLPRLIYDLWKKNNVFCGKNGNDAEEFYAFFLNELHNCCKEKDSDPCRCDIHQIFSGKHRTVEICSKCGVLNSTDLHFWSITLPYGREFKLTDCIKKHIQGTNHENSICKRCKEGTVREQLLFKVLPNILCFHFPIISKKRNKEETTQNFPKYLDMSLYTPETAKSTIWKENGVRGFKKYQSSKNMYILYAIVCHNGKQESGHYYSYVRKSLDTWYRCSDEEIRKVEFEKEVSKCSGSIFFYIKEVLEYEKPSLHLNEHEGNASVQKISIVNGYS